MLGRQLIDSFTQGFLALFPNEPGQNIFLASRQVDYSFFSTQIFTASPAQLAFCINGFVKGNSGKPRFETFGTVLGERFIHLNERLLSCILRLLIVPEYGICHMIYMLAVLIDQQAKFGCISLTDLFD